MSRIFSSNVFSLFQLMVDTAPGVTGQSVPKRVAKEPALDDELVQTHGPRAVGWTVVDLERVMKPKPAS